MLNIRKNFRKYLVQILVVGLLVFSVCPSYADESAGGGTSRTEQEVSEEMTEKGFARKSFKDFTAVDVKTYMEEMSKMSVPDATAKGKDLRIENNSREAKMFNALLANNWMITRTVVFGMSGLSEAADLLEKADHIKKNFDINQQMKMQAATGTKTEGEQQIPTQQLNSQRPTSSEEAYMNLQNKEVVVKSLREIAQMPGINAGNSIYDRVSMIAIFLLCFTFLARIAGTTWSLYIGSNRQHESPGILYMECFAKFVVFVAYIYVLKYGIAALMLLSEMIRNAIICATSASGSSGVGDLSEQLQTLITSRNMLVSGDYPLVESDGKLDLMLNSITEVLTNGIGNAIGKFIAWCVSRFYFWLTSIFITVMVILGDVMLAISAAVGPLVIALAMIKGFEGWMDNYIRSVVTFSLYMPIAGIYAVAMCMIYALVPDMGFLTYITISWAFLLGAMKIPNLAEALSGTALATMLTSFAGKVVSAAMLAARLPFSRMLGK